MWTRQEVVGRVSDENDALHFHGHGDVTEGFGHLLDRKTFTICYFAAALEQPWVEELLTQKPKTHTHSSEQKLPGRTEVGSWRLFCCLYDCPIDPSWSGGAVSVVRQCVFKCFRGVASEGGLKGGGGNFFGWVLPKSSLLLLVSPIFSSFKITQMFYTNKQVSPLRCEWMSKSHRVLSAMSLPSGLLTLYLFTNCSKCLYLRGFTSPFW